MLGGDKLIWGCMFFCPPGGFFSTPLDPRGQIDPQKGFFLTSLWFFRPAKGFFCTPPGFSVPERVFLTPAKEFDAEGFFCPLFFVR